MKYDAVIFDLFGTLVENPVIPESRAREWQAARSELAAILGVPCDDFDRWWVETYVERNTGTYPSMEATFETLCGRCGVTPMDGTISAAVERYVEHFRPLLTVPRADTVDTIARLRDAGMKIGLISDCTAVVSAIWPDTPMAALIDAAILSCDVGMRKPDPRIYHLACERLGVSPQRCMFVGDGGSNELTGAHEVGMDPVMIRVPEDDDKALPREEWAGVRVSSLSEVLTLAGLASD